MTNLADEQLLEQFRHWLDQARAEAEGLPIDAGADGAELPSVGLYHLVEEFTALRHEVKLQTRSSRGMEEETEKLLAALRQAVEALRSIEPKEAQAAWSAGKDLALALADLDEALDRGRLQLEKIASRLEEPEESLLDGVDQAFAGLSWLRRVMSRTFHLRVRELIEQARDRSPRRALMAALVDGYALIQQRLARAMSSAGLIRIATLGQTVDPEQMIVLEIVAAENGRRGVVVDEVRRGYTWNGRVLRCAEVRATGLE